MGLLNRFRAWRRRRQMRQFRRWMRVNHIVWDGAIRHDPRNSMDYFRRSITP